MASGRNINNGKKFVHFQLQYGMLSKIIFFLLLRVQKIKYSVQIHKERTIFLVIVERIEEKEKYNRFVKMLFIKAREDGKFYMLL